MSISEIEEEDIEIVSSLQDDIIEAENEIILERSNNRGVLRGLIDDRQQFFENVWRNVIHQRNPSESESLQSNYDFF